MNDLGDGDGQTVHEGLDRNLHFAEQGDVSNCQVGLLWSIQTFLHHFGQNWFFAQKTQHAFWPSSFGAKNLFCLKWSWRVQMDPNEYNRDKKKLDWPFLTLLNYFGTLKCMSSVATFGLKWAGWFKWAQNIPNDPNQFDWPLGTISDPICKIDKSTMVIFGLEWAISVYPQLWVTPFLLCMA